MMPKSRPEPPCPNAGQHTPQPRAYGAWHVWAEQMGRTHDQKRCPGCGLYEIWTPRPDAPDLPPIEYRLLHQILRELSELRERATGQQQAIDQIRSDTTAAINTGLAENRAVVRDGLHRHQEIIGDPLARISTELISIRASLNDFGRTAPAARPLAETGADRADADASINDDLLRAAAGISRAKLQAHRDTWAFLVEHAIRDRHFRIPGEVEDTGGSVTVYVSGPSLVAAVTSLHDVSRSSGSAVTRAIAGHLHKRLTDTVQAIIDNPHRGDGAEPVTITIDDRAKPAGEEED